MAISQNGQRNILVNKKIVKKNKIILIGSSMGAWISLNQFNFLKNKLKVF